MVPIQGTFDFDTTVHSTTAMGWKIVKSPTLKASTGQEIKFKDVTPVNDWPFDCYGVALDNIIVEEQENNVPVPEFPTMALPAGLIVGILGAILFIQKTKEN